MIESENFIEQLKRNFNENNPQGPELLVKWNKGKSEEYYLDYKAGKITLAAQSIPSAIFGMSLLMTATQSGHLTEFLGKQTPKFALRALWIKDFDKINKWENRDYIEILCQRSLLLGYNTLVLELSSQDIESRLHSITHSMKIINEYGLKIAVKISKSSLEEFSHYSNELIPSIVAFSENIHYLFWDSTIYQKEKNLPLKMRNFLPRDLAKLEIKTIESLLLGKCRLIYFIPTHDFSMAQSQSRWLISLSNEISEKTILSFSSCTGKASADHLPPHPFWEVLRKQKGKTHANFLPLVNAGLVGQGEGFWPTLTLDLINRYLLRCDPSLFCGAVALTAYLPNPQALLSCSLWTAGQTLWGHLPPPLLTETWLAAHCPDILKYQDYDKMLEELRKISIIISQLNTTPKDNKANLTKEEYRILTDSLISRLRVLQMQVDSQEIKAERRPDFKDYFSLFVRDARKLILRFLHYHQLPMVNILSADDRLDSFWASVSGAGFHGWASGTKVLLREEPEKGEPGSTMAQIYEEITDY